MHQASQTSHATAQARTRSQQPIPVEDVDEVERLYPSERCGCGQTLAVEVEPSVRHQVFDVPEVRYQVTEYQLYRGYCQDCDQQTTARLPDWVPSGQMGPGLISWIGGEPQRGPALTH